MIIFGPFSSLYSMNLPRDQCSWRGLGCHQGHLLLRISTGKYRQSGLLLQDASRKSTPRMLVLWDFSCVCHRRGRSHQSMALISTHQTVTWYVNRNIELFADHWDHHFAQLQRRRRCVLSNECDPHTWRHFAETLPRTCNLVSNYRCWAAWDVWKTLEWQSQFWKKYQIFFGRHAYNTQYQTTAYLLKKPHCIFFFFNSLKSLCSTSRLLRTCVCVVGVCVVYFVLRGIHK